MVSVPLNFRLSLSIYKEGFPGGAVVKNPPATAADFGFSPWVEMIPWKMKWQPTLLFLPGKSHGQKEPGCSPWGHRIRHDWAHTYTRVFKEVCWDFYKDCVNPIDQFGKN